MRIGYRGSNPKRDSNEPAIVDALEKTFYTVTRISMKDWPDLHAGKANRSLWFEVKRPGEEPTDEQWLQIQRMKFWGMEVYVVHSAEEALKFANCKSFAVVT